MKNIDLKRKYKRVFALGCSLTRYVYPTWADILGVHYESAEYINLAKPGAGNPLVMSRISQAHRYFNFDENDLIVIMYPSFTREDRFIKTEWFCNGNIFTSTSFDRDFIKKFGDITHYTIRDLSIIDLIRNFLKTLNSDVLELMSVDHQGLEPMELAFDENETRNHNMLKERYQDLFQGFPVDYTTWLYSIQTSHNSFGVKYDNRIDSHPKPIIALQYLQMLGFEINKKACDYAQYYTELLSNCTTRKQIIDLSNSAQNIHDRYYIAGTII